MARNPTPQEAWLIALRRHLGVDTNGPAPSDALMDVLLGDALKAVDPKYKKKAGINLLQPLANLDSKRELARRLAYTHGILQKKS